MKLLDHPNIGECFTFIFIPKRLYVQCGHILKGCRSHVCVCMIIPVLGCTSCLDLKLMLHVHAFEP